MTKYNKGNDDNRFLIREWICVKSDKQRKLAY